MPGPFYPNSIIYIDDRANLPTQICVYFSVLSRNTIRPFHTRIVSKREERYAQGEDLTLASFQTTETGSLLR